MNTFDDLHMANNAAEVLAPNGVLQSSEQIHIAAKIRGRQSTPHECY
jgi:hypothetical protein